MLSCCWPACVAAAEPEAPPAPATTQSADSIPALIAGLGDPDPAARDRAAKAVWAMGRQAEPALRAAAAGHNPEVARRARAILRDFDYGLYPDAPHKVFALLDQYRKGTPQEKRAAVLQLAGQGIPGLRVLLKLREDERDPNWKVMISQALAPREHEVSVLMLANGQDDEVERLLERSAVDSPVAAQDYAALLSFKGTLKQTLAAMKGQPVTADNAEIARRATRRPRARRRKRARATTCSMPSWPTRRTGRPWRSARPTSRCSGCCRRSGPRTSARTRAWRATRRPPTPRPNAWKTAPASRPRITRRSSRTCASTTIPTWRWMCCCGSTIT
jgi:hypothetical protein